MLSLTSADLYFCFGLDPQKTPIGSLCLGPGQINSCFGVYGYSLDWGSLALALGFVEVLQIPTKLSGNIGAPWP